MSTADTSLPTPCVVLFAKDAPALARFYEIVAQMSRMHEEGDHVVLSTPGLEVVIHAIPKRIAAGITITSPPVAREDTPLKLCLPVPNLADARAAAKGLGGKLNPPAKEWTWAPRGFRACDGVDPEGNVFQLRERAT